MKLHMNMDEEKKPEPDEEGKIAYTIGYCPFCEEETEFTHNVLEEILNGNIVEKTSSYDCSNCFIRFSVTAYADEQDGYEEMADDLKEKLNIYIEMHCIVCGCNLGACTCQSELFRGLPDSTLNSAVANPDDDDL